jgi:hypothetical protein
VQHVLRQTADCWVSGCRTARRQSMLLLLLLQQLLLLLLQQLLLQEPVHAVKGVGCMRGCPSCCCVSSAATATPCSCC